MEPSGSDGALVRIGLHDYDERTNLNGVPANIGSDSRQHVQDKRVGASAPTLTRPSCGGRRCLGTLGSNRWLTRNGRSAFVWAGDLSGQAQPPPPHCRETGTFSPENGRAFCYGASSPRAYAPRGSLFFDISFHDRVPLPSDGFHGEFCSAELF